MEEKLYNEGKDAEYKFVIANMLKGNYSNEEICKITGLSLEKFNDYKNDLNDVMSLDDHRHIKYDICYRKGYYKRKVSIAVSMLKEEYDVLVISKVTGLSIKNINEIKEF